MKFRRIIAFLLVLLVPIGAEAFGFTMRTNMMLAGGIEWAYRAPLNGTLGSMGALNLSTGENTRASNVTCFNSATGYYETLGNTESCYENGKLRTQQENTNSCLYGNAFDEASWTNGGSEAQDQTDIFGTANTAWTITDNNAGSTTSLAQTISTADDDQTHTVALYIGKENSDPGFYQYIELSVLTGGTTTTASTHFNAYTGTVSNSDFIVTGKGNYWKVEGSVTDVDDGNTEAKIELFPAYSSNWSTHAQDNTINGSGVALSEIDIFLDSPIAYSPIVTAGSAVTVLADLVRWTMDADFKALFETTFGTAVIDDDAADDDTGDWDAYLMSLAFDTDHYEITDTTGGAGYIYRTETTVVGQLYKWEFEIKDGTAAGIGIYSVVSNGSGNFYDRDIVNHMATTTGSFVKYTVYFYAEETTTHLAIRVNISSIGDDIEVKELNCSPVTNLAKGTMVINQTLAYGSSDAVASGMVAVGDTYLTGLYNYSGAIKGNSSDGTTFLSESAVSPEIGDTLLWILQWGEIIDNELTFDVGLIEPGESINWDGAEVFDGSFEPTTHLQLFKTGKLKTYFSDLRISEEILTDDQLGGL
jgi:hypothetical protein